MLPPRERATAADWGWTIFETRRTVETRPGCATPNLRIRTPLWGVSRNELHEAIVRVFAVCRCVNARGAAGRVQQWWRRQFRSEGAGERRSERRHTAAAAVCRRGERVDRCATADRARWWWRCADRGGASVDG